MIDRIIETHAKLIQIKRVPRKKTFESSEQTIDDLHGTRDGKVRVVSIITIKAVIKRQTRKMCPLQWGNRTLTCYFVWRFRHNSIGICIAFVKFEMNLFYVCWHILIHVRFYINIPLMCVTIFFTLFAKRTSYITIDDWFDNIYTLNDENADEFIYCMKDAQFTLTLPPESGPKSVGTLKLFIMNWIKDAFVCYALFVYNCDQWHLSSSSSHRHNNYLKTMSRRFTSHGFVNRCHYERI